MAKTLTKKKAKTILREGEVRGKKLTKRQKGFFGARAGGAPVRRKKKYWLYIQTPTQDHRSRM